jgi:exodeoxyribonuclease VII small subunit
MSDTNDIQSMTFEQAYAELTQIIEQMESGEMALEQSVTLYERGQKLAAHCDKLLEEAELRIQTLNDDGGLSDLG